MSNLADSAEATSNGQAASFLGAAGPSPAVELFPDEELESASIEARDYWAGVWLRLKRDRLALAGGAFIVLLFVVAFAGAPLAERMLGHGPNEPFLVTGGLDSNSSPPDRGPKSGN